MIRPPDTRGGRNVPHRDSLGRMPRSAGVKPRPRHELVMRLVHPLVGPGVAVLRRLGARPEQVVLAHGAVGLVAAALVATRRHGAWLVAAALLQVKTVLDNLDGSLARATGRVSELGRYLDTGVDLVVHVALFAALAAHGPWPVAALAFAVLTVLLSYDFNVERLHREAHGEGASAPGSSPAASPERATDASPAPAWERAALDLSKGLYRAVLAPATGRPAEAATPDAVRAWWGVGATAALVNLGLSTQYVVLGVCLALGAPFAYAWVVLAQGAYLIAVIAYRYVTFRRRARP